MSIDAITYAGWVGVDYEVLQFNSAFLGLEGGNGAGKTSLITALLYTLLPDKNALDIKPISDINGTVGKKTDTLLEKIDPASGYAYVALDVTKDQNSRILVGCHFAVTKIGVEISPFSMELDTNFDTYDAFNLEKDSAFYTPDFPEFRSALAKKGVTVKAYRNISDYCNILHTAGLIPTPMDSRSDRELYAKLLETSFHGGISKDILGNLKRYLLSDAAHIPESIKGMQKCTEDALKTRRTLDAATKQLRLVQATFSSGKSIVINAINNTINNTRAAIKELKLNRENTISKRELTKKNYIRITEIDDDIARLNTSKQEVTKTLKIAQKNINEESNNLARHIENKILFISNESKNIARQEIAKSIWEYTCHKWPFLYGEEVKFKNSHSELATLLNKKRDEEIGDISQLNNILQTLETNISKLELILNGKNSSTLSEALKCQTVSHALYDINEDEAKIYDLMFSGCPEGVLGLNVADIASLKFRKELPSMFWFGETLPTTTESIDCGDWMLMKAHGGYFATAKCEPSKFGHHASKKKHEKLLSEKNDLKELVERKTIHSAELKTSYDALIKNGSQIDKYLSDIEQLEQSKRKLKEEEIDLNLKNEELKKMQRNAFEIEHLIFQKENDYDEKIFSTTLKRDELTKQKIKSEQEIELLKELRTKINKTIRHIFIQYRLVKIFCTNSEFDISEAQEGVSFDHATFVSKQYQLKAQLADALKSERSENLAFLEHLSFSPDDVQSSLSIWEPLNEFLRANLPSDVEAIGEELIEQMKEKRKNLSEQLEQQLNAVSSHCSTVCKSITAQINSQKRKIDILSQIGRDLSFGNVKGLKITLERNRRMLDALYAASTNADLFSMTEQPIEEILHEHLEKSLEMKIKKEGILDYKSYVDLRIEALKTDGKGWVNAGSLSGGEAIGGGIAVVHMLFTALATNSGASPSKLNPIYAMDEIHRIDSKGQRIAIQFCEHNNIQLMATAPKLYQTSGSNLYMLARQTYPKEIVVVRKIEGFK